MGVGVGVGVGVGGGKEIRLLFVLLLLDRYIGCGDAMHSSRGWFGAHCICMCASRTEAGKKKAKSDAACVHA